MQDSLRRKIPLIFNHQGCDVMHASKRFRRLLQGPDIIVAPGAYDAISALIVQREGFPAVYLGGAAISGSYLGYPDVGLITLSEIVQVVRNIAESVEIPIISDAENGFGNPVNTRRAVIEFERAGIAGIHIEDQVSPKRCGHFEGKALIDVADMQHKIQAACEARENESFVIIARCDAIAIEGFEAALDRGEAYMEAGADMLFIECPRTLEEVSAAADRFRQKIPLFFNMAETGKTPYIPAEKLQEIGYKVVVFPEPARLAAVKQITDVMRELKKSGSTMRVKEKMVSYSEYAELIGLQKIQDLEKRYGSDPNRVPHFKPGEFK